MPPNHEEKDFFPRRQGFSVNLELQRLLAAHNRAPNGGQLQLGQGPSDFFDDRYRNDVHFQTTEDLYDLPNVNQVYREIPTGELILPMAMQMAMQLPMQMPMPGPIPAGPQNVNNGVQIQAVNGETETKPWDKKEIGPFVEGYQFHWNSGHESDTEESPENAHFRKLISTTKGVEFSKKATDKAEACKRANNLN